MNIAVFGATGLLGRKVVDEAIRRQIGVKILARDPSKLADIQHKVEVIKGDYFNPKDQERILKGVDAVISTIGPPAVRKGGPDAEAFGSSMKTLVSSMEERKINRIINVAGAATSYPGEKVSFSRKLLRLIMRLTIPAMTPAKELELSVLQSSRLAFTTVRPPMIVNGLKGTLKLSETEIPNMKVDADQLASFMLEIIGKSEWYEKVPFVGTK